MENTHHGESPSPDTPAPQQKNGKTDEQTIALTKARLAIDELDAKSWNCLNPCPMGS